MPSITIRELSRNTAGVIDDVQKSGRPALVTRNGKFVAAVVPIAEDELEDWVLSNAPEFVESMEEADRDMAAGKTRPLDAVLADLDTSADVSRGPADGAGPLARTGDGVHPLPLCRNRVGRGEGPAVR